MARSGAPLASAVVLAVLLMAASHAANAITCGQVSAAVAPCISYATKGGVIAPRCCSGARGLVSAAKTTTDRRAVCNCLKSAVGSIRGLKPGPAASIPGKSGVKVPFTVSTSTNCSKVS